jgi:preprotein translocase subunit SecE
MFLTNERAFLYSLYGLAAVLWFLLWKFFTTLYSFIPYMNFLGPKSTSDLLLAGITLAISVGAAEAVRRNQKAKDYGVDVVVETKKVTWPTRKELQGSTLIVIVMSLVAMLLILGLDKIFDALIKVIFSS